MRPNLVTGILLFLGLICFVFMLRAETPAAPNPELEAAKARIAWLEQKISAMEVKSRGCFDLYRADMALYGLSQQEPKKYEGEKPSGQTSKPDK